MYYFLNSAVYSFFGSPQNVKNKMEKPKNLLSLSLRLVPKIRKLLPQKKYR